MKSKFEIMLKKERKKERKKRDTEREILSKFEMIKIEYSKRPNTGTTERHRE